MILTAAKLITCRTDGASLDEGAIVITGGIIRAVGPLQKIKKGFPRHNIVRLQNAVLMPGLINTHTHLELPPLLDSTRANTFPEWVLNLINAKKHLNQLDYARATSVNISTLIRTGTTTVGEICTHGVSPALLKKIGLRAVVFYEKIDMGSGAGNRGLGMAIPRRNSARLTSGLSPHTPYTVSEPILQKIHEYSMKKGIRLAMHIAESKEETQLLQQKKSGLEKLYQFAQWDLEAAPAAASSFAYLQRIGFLSPRLLAVHAVQVTDKDIELIRKSKVSIAHCPRSNRETGVGRMPMKKMLDAGIAVGLGTDSLASSPSLNLWDEMRYTYHVHRRDGITPRVIFNLAITGGARALGMEHMIGCLEPGKKADIIAVPTPQKNTGDIYSDLLRETKSCIMAMVNGKLLRKEY